MNGQEAWPIKVKWVDNFQFVGLDDQGHSIVMDVPQQSGGGGSGFSPTKLLLASLAGCTAMDVVLIMRKQKQEITGLEVYATGDQNVEYPHYFTEIRLRYVVHGKNISEEAVKRAVQLSDEKYCSVGTTLKGKATIITSHEIINE